MKLCVMEHSGRQLLDRLDRAILLAAAKERIHELRKGGMGILTIGREV
jgi:hypothetical protein